MEGRPILNFFIRRFFRIVPMFWAAMALYLASGYAPRQLAPGGIHAIDVASTIFLVQSWLPASVNSVIRGDWSISTEFMFYCVLPLLFFKIRSLRQSLWLTLIAVPSTHLLSIIVRKVLFEIYPANSSSIAYDFCFFWFPAQFPVFCLGIVLYFILAPRLKSADGRESKEAELSWWLLAFSLYLILACPFGGYWYVPNHFVYGVAFLLLAWSLALNPVSIFVNRLTCYLGKISFSCYLLHDLVLRFTWPHWQALGLENRGGGESFILFGSWILTALALTMAAATASYYAIELPGIHLGKRVIKKLNR